MNEPWRFNATCPSCGNVGGADVIYQAGARHCVECVGLLYWSYNFTVNDSPSAGDLIEMNQEVEVMAGERYKADRELERFRPWLLELVSNLTILAKGCPVHPEYRCQGLELEYSCSDCMLVNNAWWAVSREDTQL